MTPLNVFWDNSNIWLVGRKVCDRREPGQAPSFRIHLERLLDFAVEGRPVSFAYVAGSVPPTNDDLWKRFKTLGCEVKTQERGSATGREIAVDELIQLEMANRILDVKPSQTIVLLTGDGSGYVDGKGFLKQIERARAHGWDVEVVSWDAGCNRYLKAFVNANGRYRPLEPVYEQVTFINNKRWAKPLAVKAPVRA